MTTRSDHEFPAGSGRCAAWVYEPPDGDDAARRPCVVMAHGFSLTRDEGLPAYAEHLAGAGVTVLVFDHRHLGDSPRERRHFEPFMGDGPKRIAEDQVDFLRRTGLLSASPPA